MKIWMSAIVALLVCGLVGVAQAEKPAKGTRPIRGQVVSVAVDRTNVVVMTVGKKGGEVTVTTDKETKVTIDGADATLADLKKDMWVIVKPGTGLATSIKASTTKPEKKPV